MTWERGKECEKGEGTKFPGKEREGCMGERVRIPSSRTVSSSLLMERKNSATFRHSQV